MKNFPSILPTADHQQSKCSLGGEKILKYPADSGAVWYESFDFSCFLWSDWSQTRILQNWEENWSKIIRNMRMNYTETIYW